MEKNIIQKSNERKKRLELTNDYVFKKIFAKPENNIELKELLEAILNINIRKVASPHVRFALQIRTA